MLEIALSQEGWDNIVNWEELAERSARAAFAASPFAGLATSETSLEISLRLTSDEEVHALNKDYRGKDKPTNVLSFPMCVPDELRAGFSGTSEILLGDIVLAHGVCAAEAKDRNITLEAHAMHLIVHGVLHLLGFDHIRDEDATEMESLERSIMRNLGLHDPYED